jgi:hypothetical protein
MFISFVGKPFIELVFKEERTVIFLQGRKNGNLFQYCWTVVMEQVPQVARIFLRLTVLLGLKTISCQ